MRKLHTSWLFLILLFLLTFHISAYAKNAATDDYFYTLNTANGLSDNTILQLMQLTDGKMVIKTQRGINIYTDSHFRFIPLLTNSSQTIKAYKGQSHLYTDDHHRLWVKDFQTVYAIDLNTLSLISNPLDSLGEKMQVEDLFVDSRHDVWVVENGNLIQAQTHLQLTINAAWGELQDVDVDDSHIYAFCSLGVVAAFGWDGKLAYAKSAYSKVQSGKYAATSLVVKTPAGQFYQIRTGSNQQSVFLHFNPVARLYQPVYSCDYILHTLNMSSDSQALISSQRGYLMFDFRVGNNPKEITSLSLPDGTSLVTGINTVYRDHDGGIWLGTYKNGLIYVSPLLGLFFTADKPWWHGVGGVVLICIAFVIALIAIGILYYKLKLRHIEPISATASVGNIAVDNDEAISLSISNSDPFLSKLQTLVEQHIAESDYGVEQLARDMCMERTGLYKKLKASADETPVGFIRSVRLAKAAEMLKSSAAEGYTVNEIAELTGFASPSYFTKCFKAKYGVKPSEYR